MPTYRYVVTGKGHFPLDMLRYDCCWPEDSDSVMSIVDEPDDHEDPKEFTNVTRVIHMASGREPTAARWASFGWTVRDIRKM